MISVETRYEPAQVVTKRAIDFPQGTVLKSLGDNFTLLRVGKFHVFIFELGETWLATDCLQLYRPVKDATLITTV